MAPSELSDLAESAEQFAPEATFPAYDPNAKCYEGEE